MHVVAPVWFAKVPALHHVHVPEFALLYFPTGHTVHAEEPAAEEYPAKQLVHV